MLQQSMSPGIFGQHPMFIRNVPMVDTDDIEIARESLISTTLPQKYDVDSAVKFYFQHRKIFIKTVSISDLYYRPQSYVSSKEMEDFFCFLIPLQGQQELQQDDGSYTIGPGEVFVADLNRNFKQVISAEHRMINIRVDRVVFDNFLRNTIEPYPGKPLDFTKAPVAIAGAAASLFEFVQFLCRESLRDPTSSATEYNEIVAQQIEQSMLAMLLSSLPNNYQKLLMRTRQQSPSNIITLAEKFIRENMTRPITVTDIAAATGVSERTLYYAFADFHHMTPLKFLKIERLKLARTMLQRKAKALTSVCDIALACGFNHLSKFSKDYSQQFGELPRETLKKSG